MLQTLRKFTIRVRMYGAIAMVVLALLGIAGVGLVALAYAQQQNQSFIEREFASMTEIAALRHGMSQLRVFEKDMIISFDRAAEVRQARAKWQDTYEAILTIAQALRQVVPSESARGQVDAALQHLAAFRAGIEPVALQLEQEGFDTARVANTLIRRVHVEYERAQGLVEALGSDLTAAAAAGTAKVARTVALAQTVVGGALGLILLLTLPLTVLNLRSICRPIEQADELARRIAEGDLTPQCVDLHGRDETARLLNSLAAMRGSLCDTISRVHASTESIATASAEISSGNHDLSARTEQAASNLQQTAASMDQLTGTVRQSADAASTANQLASNAAQAAQRGGAVVSSVVTTMEEISSASKRIADIIGVIDGIAFQTNILALNAAVEAARAGEQGRGFAVVAAEVRNLAQRSAQAAKEIKALIGASVERVDSGSRLVQDAGATMNEIVASVQRVTDIIAEITAAAAEQSDGIGQVNQAVTHLDQMTQQNAALVEQSAAAAESLKEQAQRLAAVVGTFRLMPAEMGQPRPQGAQAA